MVSDAGPLGPHKSPTQNLKAMKAPAPIAVSRSRLELGNDQSISPGKRVTMGPPLVGNFQECPADSPGVRNRIVYCNDKSCLPEFEKKKISFEVVTDNTASLTAANLAEIQDKNFELTKENLTMKNQIDLQNKTIRSLRSDVSKYETEISSLQLSSLITSTPQNERLSMSPQTSEIDRNDHEKLVFESQHKSKVIISMETEIAIITEQQKKTQLYSGLLLQSNADKENLTMMIENLEKTIQELTEHNSELQHQSIRNYSKVSE
jgi:hypothetical protein